MKIGLSTEHIIEKETGVGDYAYNIISNLLSIDKKNKYYLIHNRKINKDIFNKTNNLIIPLPKIKPRELLWHFYTLPKKLEKLGLDIFHSTAQLNSISNTKYKKMITIHDLAAIKFPHTHNLYPRLSAKYILPKVISKSDKIIAVSENTKKDIINYFKVDKDKIEVIYEAAEKIFKPVKTKKVLEKYNIDQPYILYVGTIEPRKNINLIIKAFQEIKRNNLPHKLVIVGKFGWKYQSILTSLKGSNDIILTGYVKKEDLPEFYSNAEFLVYPSLYEGFGLPPLQAMACSCPVISSNTSSLPEVIGNAGILINPKDKETLKSSMLKLIKDRSLISELKKKGLKQSKKFSWEESAKKTLNIYNSL